MLVNYKNYCVLNSKNEYKTCVLVLLKSMDGGEITETIQYYTLGEGEILLDALSPIGFVCPRWEHGVWVEGATPEELTAWKQKHPAPAPPPPTLEARTAALESAMLELIGGESNV